MTERLWRKLADAFVCISLHERRERRAKTQREFDRVGLKCQYYLATKHPTNTNKGIFESHQRAIQLALESTPNAQRIMIMEDDLAFAETAIVKRVLWELIAFVNDSDITWDHIRLGGIPTWFYQGVPGYEHVYKINFSLCSHAYLITSEFARAVLRKSYISGLPFDNAINFWSPFRQYICDPMLAYQRDDPSDNVNAILACVFTPLRDTITHKRCMEFNRAIFKTYRCTIVVIVALMVTLWVRIKAH